MTIALSSSENSLPELLQSFEQELLGAHDPQVVLERYKSLHPALAATFRELAEAVQMLQETPFRPAEEPASAGSESNSPKRFGPYRVIRAVGRGGMGEVYEAVEEPLARRVAVKTIRRSQSTSAISLLRFDRERRTLAKLHHTNIVPIFATGCEGELLYFAMPYLAGASLGQVIKTALSRGSSGSTLSSSSFEQLLQEAHSRSQSPSENLAQPGPTEPKPAPPAEGQATDAGSPGSAPSSVSNRGPGPSILSKTYVRTAVSVMAAVAEGVHHANGAGVVHRDLKPSNIMVETTGHAWVLDFGLASLNTSNHDAATAPLAFAIPAESDASLTAGPIGTPPYMAPEQHQDGTQADARADVWGLGATLYELLTLQRAFPTGRSVLEDEPKSPRQLNPHLDRDLEAVVLKALRKDPAHRYATAGALADDLNHWLRHEPTTARPARAARRLALWSRRNPGWAAAIALATLGFVAVSVAAVSVNKTRADAARAVALAAGAKQHQAEDRAAAEHRQAQTQRREALIQQIQRVRLTDQRESWSTAAWDLARRAAAIERDPRIQAEAAALLAGIDVRKLKSLALPGGALAFNPTGKSLMIGAFNPLRRGSERPIQVWDSTTDQVQPTQVVGAGVFGFRADGTPLFLKFHGTDRSTVQLWDVPKAQVLREFKSPVEGKSAISAFALTPDGKSVAASAQALNENAELAGTGVIAVWDTASGGEIFRSASRRVTDVALAPDASLLAAGHEDGQITVWSLPNVEPIATLKADRNRINRVVFGRDPVRRPGPKPPGSGWLLATGDQGGGVVIWDLRLKTARSICHGRSGTSEVLALAFSPDAMTLASTGRAFVQLWDIASGRLLLNILAGNYVTALAFSPHGEQLAVGSVAAFGYPDSVNVWALDPGRGIDSLRGLLGSVFTSVFSPDGRLVAGLSNDWRVGIWDRSSHRLLHVLEVNPGFHADNAALAFSPDGRQLAFAAGREAALWDVATGEIKKTWRLPPGLVDLMAFTEPSRLLLFREETETGEVGPFTEFDPIKYPRVCRVRDLLGGEPLKLLAEIRDCNIHVFHAACSPDGRYYVIEGTGGSTGKVTRIANLYESATGKKLGTLPTQNSIEFGYAAFEFDPTGTVLSYFYDKREQQKTYLLEMPSRAIRRQFEGDQPTLGPHAKRWLIPSKVTVGQPPAFNLFEEGRPEPLIKFVLDFGNAPGTARPRFSPDGLHLVWGNPSGDVTVVDLVEVNTKLTELDLGW